MSGKVCIRTRYGTFLCVSVLMASVSSGASGQDSYSVHRQASVQRSAKDMTTCAATLLQLIRPDLHYFPGTGGEWQTLAGAPRDDIKAATWVIAAKDADDRSSEIRLLSLGATKTDLDDAWGVIETCEKQR